MRQTCAYDSVRKLGVFTDAGGSDWYDRDAWYLGVSAGLLFGGEPDDRPAAVMPAEPAPAPAAPEPAPPPPPDPDVDGDGVLNADDACPDTAVGRPVDARGCELPAEIALPDVRFQTNSDELEAGAEASLDAAAATLLQNPGVLAEVAGYTDDRGDAAYNRDLSERRAKRVRNYLVVRGVPAGQLTWRGYGESEPIADNSTSERCRQNRRVILRLLQ